MRQPENARHRLHQHLGRLNFRTAHRTARNIIGALARINSGCARPAVNIARTARPRLMAPKALFTKAICAPGFPGRGRGRRR